MLEPTQLAQLALISGPNLDSEQVDRIFDQLELNNAFENVDQFLAGLSRNEMVEYPDTG